MKDSYKEADRMYDVLCDEHHLFQMLSRFGIPLGFGEKNVREVCKESNVDVTTFLAVANYVKVGPEVASYYVDKVSAAALTDYLKRAHSYFLDFQLPDIRRRLVSSINCSDANEVAFLILQFFDEFMRDVRHHMEAENNKMFKSVDRLLQGGSISDTQFLQFARSNENFNHKLQELKNLIIKYYKGDGPNELLNMVLFDLFNCEEDLQLHRGVENDLFLPAVELLMERTKGQPIQKNENDEALSEREREIVICIARGMSNKDVADKLFISVNTVLTHRKNIFRKLDIHSISGLTIYAVVNGLITLDEIRDRK
ncbi:response regulator transcription factor [Alloprevotella rava]|uniref:Regulator of cell morphogenesis and NO signaling n=1 Tax=Alloprevotella rava TaxID=671218 RepID=A0A7W5UGW7_9BACT|nr:response regulator transcription factor [Alloprevotella rava]MBB3702316.1 regulator of cell morphogenesis and NO signaling [Alloprevotella rava]